MAPVPPAPCSGCYKPAEVNQEIVDFAVSELQSGDQARCSSGLSHVENFQSQVTLLEVGTNLEVGQMFKCTNVSKAAKHFLQEFSSMYLTMEIAKPSTLIRLSVRTPIVLQRYMNLSSLPPFHLDKTFPLYSVREGLKKKEKKNVEFSTSRFFAFLDVSDHLEAKKKEKKLWKITRF